MSHLSHINAYKQSLIDLNITNPYTQAALTRVAYACAFIRLFQQENIPQSDHKDIIFYLTSYWNETFPVNGNLVHGIVSNYYGRLYEYLATIKGNILLTLSLEEEVMKHPEYNDPATFHELVDALFEEAKFKYKEVEGNK